MNIKKAIIIVLFFVLTAALIFTFKDKIFPADKVKNNEIKSENQAKVEPQQDYLIVVKTDKTIYDQSEPVKFSIANNGKKDIWFFSLPKSCEKDIYFSIKEKNNSWGKVPFWPVCMFDENDIEIKKMENGKSVDDSWDKKVFFNGETYAQSGIYKIGFYYSENEITKDNIKSLEAPKEILSDEFEIKPSSENSVIPDQLLKDRDGSRKYYLNWIKTILESYKKVNNDKYPISVETSKLSNSSGLRKELIGFTGNADFQDPKYPEFYYGYKSDGSYFELTARLENLNDKECELIKNDLCIYKIDSNGNISKRK